MDSVGRAQQRRCDTAGETDDVCGDWSFGHTGECAFDGVVDLVFVVGTGGKSGAQGPADLDPGQRRRHDRGVVSDVPVERCLQGVGLGFLHRPLDQGAAVDVDPHLRFGRDGR
jgi:hypothetical protein